jgi:hypothetical protein
MHDGKLIKVENYTSASALHVLALRMKQSVKVPVNMILEKEASETHCYTRLQDNVHKAAISILFRI